MDNNEDDFRYQLLIQVMQLASINDARLTVMASYLSQNSNWLNKELTELEKVKMEAVAEVGETLKEIMKLSIDDLLKISIEIKKEL